MEEDFGMGYVFMFYIIFFAALIGCGYIWQRIKEFFFGKERKSIYKDYWDPYDRL